MRIHSDTRRRIAFAVITGLMIFLIASLYHELKNKDAEISALAHSNQTIIDKLTEIFSHTIAAETAALDAGLTPKIRIEDILTQIKGIDQTIIDQALQKAYQQVAKGATGATGPTGAVGPQGPAGKNATTTTTKAAASSTSSTTTTRAPPITSTTTTTKPCVLNLAGLKIGCP